MTHHQFYFIIKIFRYILFSSSLAIHPYALGTVTQVDKLSFGNIVVLDNSTISEITVSTQGKVTYTNDIRIIDLGHPAYFVLSEFTTYTQLFTVASVLTAESVSSYSGSQQFTLTNLTTASSVTTNATGIAEVIIGGTLQSSGSGTNMYYDDTYISTLQLIISY